MFFQGVPIALPLNLLLIVGDLICNAWFFCLCHTIVYLQDFTPDSGKRGRGWSVDFSFENKSDVPFNIEKIVYYYYQDGVVRNYGEVPFSDIRHLMNNDKLLSINDPLVFGFGTDHLFYTDFKCTICGTDDNGNYIEASATVQYSKEYADAASTQ